MGFFVDGPDCRLWVEVRGAGPPVSVWAHGLSSSIEEIEPFAAATPGTRVLFDLRGHGRSDRPPPDAGYGYDAMARDLSFVAEQLDATRAFCVSVSADALLRIVAAEPARFERFALFIPGACDEPNRGAGEFPAVAATLETTPLETYADEAMRDPGFAMLFERRPKWRRLVRQRILRMNADGVPRALRTYAMEPAPVADAAALRRVTAPALVLGHEDDPVHQAAVARRIASLLPNATLRIWDEPLAMLDDVPAFGRLVGSFLGA